MVSRNLGKGKSVPAQSWKSPASKNGAPEEWAGNRKAEKIVNSP